MARIRGGAALPPPSPTPRFRRRPARLRQTPAKSLRAPGIAREAPRRSRAPVRAGMEGGS